MTWRAAIPLVALAAAGCTWGETPAPVVTGVETSATPVLRGAQVLVTVTGSGFDRGVVVDFDDPAASKVCGALRVELRDGAHAPVELQDTRVLSPRVIRARLAGDAVKSTWNLAVIGEDGREATLDAAVDVVNCPTNPPNAACDDGDGCTYDVDFAPYDKCTGASSCAGASSRPDGTDCAYPCTTGDVVAGTCAGGRCMPLAGLCDPPPACTAP